MHPIAGAKGKVIEDFVGWMNSVAEQSEGQFIAINGKRLLGSLSWLQVIPYSHS